MESVTKDSICRLGWLLLELMGKGVVLSKGQVVEACHNGRIMSLVLEEVRKINYYSPWVDENSRELFQDEIEALNELLCQWLSDSRLDRDEDADNYHIYDKETQGLNTLLVILLEIFCEKFDMKENKKVND